MGIYGDMGKWGGWRRRSRRGGSGFWRLPPFALPFRLLAGFKGNGSRRVPLFALPFCPAPRRGGSEFQPLPPFTLPFRLLAGFKGNGFRLVSLFALPFALLRGEKATNFSAFPHLRCLSAHAPENDFFRQTHCNPAPGMVQYRVSSNVSRHACMAGNIV